MNATITTADETDVEWGQTVPARMPPPRPVVCPASGPADVRAYVTLAEIDRADSGALTPDGRVAVVVTAEQRVTEIDLHILDQLETLKWVEYPDEKSIRVSEKGRYWLAKFYKANRFRGGR